MVVHIHREIEATLSSLPALLSLKGINKQLLHFWVLSHVSLTIPERFTGLPVNGQDRWNVTQVTDLVRPLIFRLNSGVKSNVTPAPLGLNCIYCGSNTKAWSSLRLPAEAMIRRKTVS